MTSNILAIGDLTVDQVFGPFRSLPAWGNETEYSTTEIRLGGNTGNFAVAGSSLGMPVTCIGPIGEDENARWILDRMSDLGLSTAKLSSYKNSSTCLTTALVRDDGERLFVTNPGAMNHLDDLLTETQFPEASAAMFSGWCQPPRVSVKTLLSCFDQLRDQRTKVIFDLYWSEESWKVPAKIIEILGQVDIALMNDLEAQELTHTQDPLSAVHEIAGWENTPQTLIVKCGAEGAILTSRGCPPVRVAGVRIDGRFDTVGAGDTFNAAFVFGHIVQQMPPERAAQFACEFTSFSLSQGRSKRRNLDDFTKWRSAGPSPTQKAGLSA